MSGLREQLETIYTTNGKLTPRLVVEAARPKSSPLHSTIFDRPVKDAAEAYYLERARELIGTFRVVYREATETEAPGTVRQWHAVRSEGADEYVYEPVEKVVHDPFTRQLVLRDMERQWQQLYQRYSMFEEFSRLILNDLEATG